MERENKINKRDKEKETVEVAREREKEREREKIEENRHDGCLLVFKQFLSTIAEHVIYAKSELFMN